MTDEIHHLQVEIDQYKRRIEELETEVERYQAIYRLLPGASHDFRTALSSLCGFPLLLLETPLTPKQRKYTETIRDASRYFLTLVNDYMDVIKIEAGQMEIDRFPLDVQEMVKSVIERFTESAIKQDISLTYAMAPDVPPIIISDRQHVQEILTHLLAFARGIINQGTVSLSVACEQPTGEDASCTLHFSVHESGVYRAPQPFREQWIKEIQEFFTQERVTNIPAGIDVRLLLCRQLSDVLGGTLRVEREAETHSTTFHFALPCEAIPHFDGRIIAVVGEKALRDEEFCQRMVSICQNTEDAWVGEMMTDRFSTTSPYTITSPLFFNFSKQPVRFLQTTSLDEDHLRTHLLSQSQGIVVNLSGRALDGEYLASNDWGVIALKKALRVVYETHQPTIIVVEDIREQPVEKPAPAKSRYIQDGLSVVKILEEQPSTYFTLEDDIWQHDSSTMQCMREILNVPERIPLLPYTHDKPASLEHILLTLLRKIEDTHSETE